MYAYYIYIPLCVCLSHPYSVSLKPCEPAHYIGSEQGHDLEEGVVVHHLYIYYKCIV